jgi:hypothetical protein
MNDLKDTLFHIIPFLSIMSDRPPENRPALTRLLEQALVGVASAFLAVTVTQAKQEEQIRHLTMTIADQSRQARKDREELSAQIERIRADLYIPRGKN